MGACRERVKDKSIIGDSILFSSLDFVDVDVAVHDGVDGECGNTLHTQLFHDILAVGDDGGEADVQAVGNLFVDVSLYDECHHFDFPVGQDFVLQYTWNGWQMLALYVGMLL